METEWLYNDGFSSIDKLQSELTFAKLVHSVFLDLEEYILSVDT